MRHFPWILALACSACGAILGLDEPTLDNTLGDAATTDGAPSEGGEGGACTTDCLGGACVNGACQPVLIAGQQGSPWFIAQYGSQIYWTNYDGNTVMGADKLDASTFLIAAGTSADTPFGIDADDSGVYFANNGPSGTVLRCDPSTGCNAQSILTDGGATNTDLRLNEGYVYYLQTDFDEIDRIKISNLVDTDIAMTSTAGPGDDDARIATDGTFIYWSEPNGDKIMHKNITSGNATTLFSLPSGSYPTVLVLDSGVLYFATGGTGAGTGGVWYGNSDGTGGAQSLAGSQHTPYGITTDATDVYWTTIGDQDSNGNITVPGGVFRCAKTGCNGSPTQLASGLIDGRGIVVDDVAIYYAEYGTGNGDGKIWRLAK